MAPHSSTLAWKTPWTEEPGGLQSMGSLESDTTERLHFHFSLSCIREGNGNPLQCSCLENPRDGGAWWAAIYGVTQSRTRLKWLSSSSNPFQTRTSLTPQKEHKQRTTEVSVNQLEVRLVGLKFVCSQAPLGSPTRSSGFRGIPTLVFLSQTCPGCLSLISRVCRNLHAGKNGSLLLGEQVDRIWQPSVGTALNICWT